MNQETKESLKDIFKDIFGLAILFGLVIAAVCLGYYCCD